MIVNQQRQVRIARKPLEKFLREVQKELRVDDSAVTVCFVSDVEIAEMNARFRKKKGPTDVLSFPQDNSCLPLTTCAVGIPRRRPGNHSRLRAPKMKSRAKRRRSLRESGPAYLGDIAIAPETARRYAKKNGRTLESELRVLILHGVLHLLGYDHETDRGQMNRLEQKLRRTFGLV